MRQTAGLRQDYGWVRPRRRFTTLALLYDRHAPMVFGAAIRLLDGSPEAERAVEQIFPALWRGAPGLGAARTPVRPWLLAQLVQPGAPWQGGRARGASGVDTPILAVGAAGDALGRR